ncbi:fungal-specific transcription factor domain-containing protein [Flagelloscypha sp. PMI_526]|nr:fungal-specific transcription factor domain-containing protein [Flagelloscypha sp. PMI_526]
MCSAWPRCDAAAEFAKVRQSLQLLENYIFPHQTPLTVDASNESIRRPSIVQPFKHGGQEEQVRMATNVAPPSKQPGLRTGGLYQGPTSAASHLVPMAEGKSDSDESSRRESQERELHEDGPQDYDRDLLAALPPIETIDGLIDFYFQCCNWVYRHVHESSFMNHWGRYKSGATADRLVLSTACAIMAIASRYLPYNHSLLEGMTQTHDGIGNHFYDISTTALQRRQSETKVYNLELVELLLIRSHYLTMLKSDSEEIWHVRGELCTIGTAMGLHRDPGKWRMHRDVAERRRWAWWHIILFERWQAFMFGRPLAIAAHHYDTQLPSYCNPAIDKSGRLYLPNLALFQLAHILADVVDDAVSVRTVPYESVQANDRALMRWMENLPPELDLDEYRVARSLASTDTATRRLGVQSVIIRSAWYHIRFTLHRPYAVAAHNPHSPLTKSLGVTPSQAALSLETAVNAADKLITMVGQSRPDFLANSALAVPGHMNWGPFHVFSAGMFFSFQLISNPDQPGAGLFRQSIKKALSTLELARGSALADNAIEVLQALTTIYSPEFIQKPRELRETQKAQILTTVRALAFPYHDIQNPRQFSDSPSGRGLGSSPATSSSAGLYTTSSLPSTSLPSAHQDSSISPAPTVSPTLLGNAHHVLNYPQFAMPSAYGSNQHNDPGRFHSYPDSAVWGASVGINVGEWTNFIDGIKPDTGRHPHG